MRNLILPSLLVALASLVHQAVAQVGTRVIPPYPSESGTPFWGYATAMNSTYLASGDAGFNGGQGIVRVFDLKTGRTVRTFNGSLAGGAFGNAAALRGSELIVGSPNAFGSSGLVSFFDIPSGRLLGVIDPGTLALAPSLAGGFGSSIACDGELVVIGAPNAQNGGLARGAVAITFRGIGSRGDGGVISALVPSDPQDDANFGHSVAVYGSTVAVGAPNYDQPLVPDGGKVYLYKGVPYSSGSSFTETLSDSSGAIAAGDAYGWAVALSPSHLIASSPFNSVSTGAVWFRNHLDSSRPVERENGANALDQFGYSIAATESLVAIGSPGYDHGTILNSGQVTIYQEPSDAVPFTLINDGFLERPFVINGSVTGQSVVATGSQVTAGSPGKGDLVTASFSTSNNDSAHLITIEASSGETVPSYASSLITGFSSAAVSGVGPYQSRTLSSVNTIYPPGYVNPGGRAKAFLMPYQNALVFELPGSLSATPISLVGNTGNYYGYSPVPYQFRAFAGGTISESLVVERNLLLAQVAIKSFSPPRHAQAQLPGNEFFSFPAIYQTKPGGLAVTPASDSGFTLFEPTGAENLTLQEGVSIFPPTGDTIGQFNGRLAHEFRNVIFPCSLLGSPASIDSAIGSYDTVASTYAMIAREGDAAPDATPASATFSAFLGETSDGFLSHGAVLFHASLRGSGVTSVTNEGLWVLDTALSPLPIRIAQKGIPVGLLKGTPKITRFLRYGIDRNGGVIVLAHLAGNGISAANNVALIEFRYGGLASATVLLQKGKPAPGTNGAPIKSIAFVDGRTSGHWAALVTLSLSAGRADASNDLALYTHSTAGIHDPVLALRKGSRFSRPGSEILKSILLSAAVTDGRSGALGIGVSHVVGNDRSVAAILTFSDGAQSLATVNP